MTLNGIGALLGRQVGFFEAVVRSPYMLERLRLDPALIILLLIFVYQHHRCSAPEEWVIVGVMGFAALVLLGARRRVVYAYIVAALVALVGWMVFVEAEKSHDVQAGRDEAVEIAAARFLQGRNLWAGTTNLDNSITTGQSSVLMALPFIALRGKVNALSFMVWIYL